MTTKECSGGETCRYGQWVHKECMEDLKAMTEDEIGKLEEYYCHECQIEKLAQEADEDLED